MPRFSAFAAGSVTLAWNQSSSTNVVGYNIYSGLACGVYNSTVFVAGLNSTNTTLSGLAEGTKYYFAATAMDALGVESQFSNETSYTVPTNSTPNQPPTLDPLNNVTINENSGWQIVNLSGITSGATNATQTLTVTAVSSNPNLIPNPLLDYTSPNSTGELGFTPVPGGYGTATITVTVNNNDASNNVVTQSFTVTVNAVPALDPLNNLIVVENSGPQSVNLTGISSGLTNTTQKVTVDATSSNMQLIPTPTISYTSPNSYGTLSFTPALNGIGTSTISVSVNNAQPTNNILTRSFTITVVTADTAKTVAATLEAAAPPSNGPFTLTVNGVSGYSYVVQVSTNLVSWDSVLTNTAPFTFVDTNASQCNQRFYRSLYLP
jgi:hypothetical protein